MVGGYQRSLKGEDCYATRQEFIGGDSISFILVADGHGGRQVSSYISSRLLERVCTNAVDGSADSLNAACSAAFKQVHQEVCSPNFDSGESKAGSTLTVVCVNVTRGEVSTWNVGDSMALLVENDGYVELGVTHRLEESTDEQERVVAKGATLGRAVGPDGQPGGPIRAFPGGLAVTRGIGDADCEAFVVPEPAFVTRQAHAMGGALLACSDGVWDHLSAEEAAAVLFSGKYSDGKTAAAQVVKTAIAKTGITDDTTACVILFGPPTGSPDASKEGSRTSHEDALGDTAASNDKGRHNSFLRHVGSARDQTPDGSKNEEDDSNESLGKKERSVLLLAASERADDINSSSPVPTRPPSSTQNGRAPDGSVKGGRAFANVTFAGADSSERGSEMPTGADEEDNEPAPSSGHRRPPPSWAVAPTGVPPTRQSVRVPTNIGFVTTISSPPKRADEGRKGGSPGFMRKGGKGGSRASLAGLFDRVVGGDSRRLAQDDDDMDGSKRSDIMDGSAYGGEGDSGKGDSFNDNAGSPPWQGVPIGMRRIVNADPKSAWRSDSSVQKEVGDGSGVKGVDSKAIGIGTLRNEESGLRGAQLTVNGRLPEQVRSVEWASLDAQMDYLGQGEFATAHKTAMEGKKVAIKMLKKSKQDSPSALKGIKREIMLMTLMTHPNVLPAHALGQHEGKPFIIIELLASVLHKELPRDPDTVPFWVRWREVKAWPLMRCLNCGLQLARALKYCHDDAFPGYRILHRDVKPNNIGFLANGDLVLFDFGLASLWRTGTGTDDEPRQLTGETGSMRYMAPEVANSQKYNHKAEVYSFASVLWELCSHRKPFLEYSSPDLFKTAVAKGVTPKINSKWPAGLQSLFKDCWALDMAQRPEFGDVVPRLELLLKEVIATEGAKMLKKPPPKPAYGYPASLVSPGRTMLTTDEPPEASLSA